MDAAVRVPPEGAADLLAAAAAARLDDLFEFEVGRPDQAATARPRAGSVSRFAFCRMVAFLESFHLDIGAGDPLPGEVEYLTGPPLLEFA